MSDNPASAMQERILNARACIERPVTQPAVHRDRSLPVAVAAAGPYMPLAADAMLQSGHTYLMSAPPVAGMTLAQAIESISRTMVVHQSWDVGQMPPNWPSSDSDPNRWRLSITQASSAERLSANATAFLSMAAKVSMRPKSR